MRFLGDRLESRESGTEIPDSRLHDSVISDKILEKATMNVKKVKRIIILVELNVEVIGILSRVLSGHNNQNYHQNRIQLSSII